MCLNCGKVNVPLNEDLECSLCTGTPELPPTPDRRETNQVTCAVCNSPATLDVKTGNVTCLACETVRNEWGDLIESNFNSKVGGGGLRYNEGKVPMEMIPLHLLDGAAQVFHQVTTREKNPYPPWNWARGMDWSEPYACMIRHLKKWYRGKDNDEETGLNHLHHVMCNLLMLIHYIDTCPDKDNRPKEYFSENITRPSDEL